jgi:hypothetical protein
MVFYKEKFQVLYFFFLYVNNYQKLFMENLNQFYLQLRLVLYLPITISRGFKNNIKIEFESLNKWFKAIRLSLNFYQSHFTHSQLKIVRKLI